MLENWLFFLFSLADRADEIATRYFDTQSFTVNQKEDQTPVSQADIEIEKAIRSKVAKTQPEMSVFGEEMGDEFPNAPLKLVIDPIDATVNFIRGIPIFATLLAIMQEGHIIAGVISAPKTRDRWWAAKGKGAFHNGSKITVSSVTDLRDAHVFHGSIAGPETQKNPKNYIQFLSSTKRQRGFGDYYGAMQVAMGCGECFCDFGIKPWDMAPIQIIIEEAGGRFSDLNGNATIFSENFIASNGHLHEKIVNALK